MSFLSPSLEGFARWYMMIAPEACILRTRIAQNDRQAANRKNFGKFEPLTNTADTGLSQAPVFFVMHLNKEAMSATIEIPTAEKSLAYAMKNFADYNHWANCTLVNWLRTKPPKSSKPSSIELCDHPADADPHS
jgi:hypothetical protein